MVRDDRGKVQMHSRRAFSDTNSLQDAKYNGLLWDLDSCHAHHLNRVILAIDDATLPNVILIPKAWPNFRCQYAEIMTRLKKLERWRVMKEDKSTNTWAFLIAKASSKGVIINHMLQRAPRFGCVIFLKVRKPFPMCSWFLKLMAENVCCLFV